MCANKKVIGTLRIGTLHGRVYHFLQLEDSRYYSYKSLYKLAAKNQKQCICWCQHETERYISGKNSDFAIVKCVKDLHLGLIFPMQNLLNEIFCR